MSGRFAVEVAGRDFDDLEGVGVVFHGINKSGSLAMATAIGEAYAHAGRAGEYLCHYTSSRLTLNAFRDRVEAQRGRTFAVGHSLYGSLRPAPRRLWVTQFRHPLPRLISVHQWLRREHAQKTGSDEGYPDLATMVRRWKGVNHSQVAQFARSFGREAGTRPGPRGLRPPQLLELSIMALEREFHWIGIAERFEESILGFAALCGLPSVAPWERDTRNAGRPLVTETDEATLDLIREAYAADFALYDWALKRFEEQLARARFGPSLEAYKAACVTEYKDRILRDAESGADRVTLGRPEEAPGVLEVARSAIKRGLRRVRDPAALRRG